MTFLKRIVSIAINPSTMQFNALSGFDCVHASQGFNVDHEMFPKNKFGL